MADAYGIMRGCVGAERVHLMRFHLSSAGNTARTSSIGLGSPQERANARSWAGRSGHMIHGHHGHLRFHGKC
jgi:hypothetical protein